MSVGAYPLTSANVSSSTASHMASSISLEASSPASTSEPSSGRGLDTQVELELLTEPSTDDVWCSVTCSLRRVRFGKTNLAEVDADAVESGAGRWAKWR